MSHCSNLSATTDWNKLAYPRLCGLIAAAPSKLGQAMHNAAFAAAGLPFQYTAFATERTEIALEAMRELGIRGLSLTIPHKERAMSLVDAISPEVKSIGAINTVINSGTTLLAHNTDYIGVQNALSETSWNPTKSSVLVFGAGGAARAAIYALKDAGCTNIKICNRSPKRAEDLAQQFTLQTTDYNSLNSLSSDSFEVFINTTSLGMPGGPKDCWPFSLSLFNDKHIVFDMVTNETELTKAAKANGSRVVYGIRMLLHQAVEQNRLFAEHSPDVAAMEAALMDQYQQQLPASNQG